MKLKIILIIAVCFTSHLTIAQQLNKVVKFHGDAGLYGDFYNMDSDSVGAINPRRPGTVSRLVVNAALNIKNFSMPVSIAIPFQRQSSIILNVPAVPKTPILNFIRNPQNRVGIAPKYKWIQLLLGSQVPQYSELSVGDFPVFGAGINLTPGKFRISSFIGTSQLAVEEDSLNNTPGIYARKIYSAKIGYGHEDSSHVYLIGSMMKDDTSSLNFHPTSLVPQEGVLSAIDFRLNIGKKSYLKGEIAGSAFTRNSNANTLEEFYVSVPESLFNPKESSRIDFAAVVSAGTNFKNFGIKAIGRYYGDGFVPLGYPFLQTDRLEITVDPRFSILQNKLQFTGSIGQRVNNLSGIRATTTTQTIGSANVNILLNDKLSVASSYSNFGFRNSLVNDTFRVELVTQSWSISPTYSYTTEKSMHNLTVMYSQNVFKDFNTLSGELNDNNASNGVLTYMLSKINTALTVSTTLSYFSNQISLGKIVTNSANASIGYKFFEKKLGTIVGLTITDNKINSEDAGFQIMTLLGVKYTLKKKFILSFNGSINLFEFGVTRPGISYREDLLRTSLTYKL